MKRIKIAIYQLGEIGESKYQDEWKFIKKLAKENKSEIFDLKYEGEIPLPKNCDMGWSYSNENLLATIEEHKNNEDADKILCFVHLPLDKNLFLTTLNKKIMVATFYQADKILNNANVNLKNYILLYLYKISVNYVYKNNGISDLPKLRHNDTRICLFDYCGNKEDIIFKATMPRLCPACEDKIRTVFLSKGVSGLAEFAKFLSSLNNELKQIKKPLYYRIVDKIKKHPIVTLIITILTTLLLNVVSSLIYDAIFN